jgi:prepilin-type N-terminal cleavage/methylation domain-containing protein
MTKRQHGIRNSQLGFSLIELMVVVAITGILSVLAIPTFVRYMRQAKTVEAVESLAKISDGASAWYQAARYDSCGSLAPKAFPGQQMVTAGSCGFSALTPDWVPNDQLCSNYPGEKCPGITTGKSKADPPAATKANGNSAQSNASWKSDGDNDAIFEALRFTLPSDHYYNYKFVAAGSEKSATFQAMACGDLNHNASGKPPAECNNAKLGLFKRLGSVDADGSPSVGGVVISNEIE